MSLLATLQTLGYLLILAVDLWLLLMWPARPL